MNEPTLSNSATPGNGLLARLQRPFTLIAPSGHDLVARVTAGCVVPWEAASGDDDPAEAAPVPAAVRRQRKRTLASTLRAARKAGADRVIVDGVVIVLSPAAAVLKSDANEWDAVLSEVDHGPH